MANNLEILEKDLLWCKRTYQLSRWIISPGLVAAGMILVYLGPPGTTIVSEPLIMFLLVAGVILWGVFHHLTLRYAYRYWQCIRWQRGQDCDVGKFWSDDGYVQAFYKW